MAKLHAERVIAARKQNATVAELTTEAYKAALNEGLTTLEKPVIKVDKPKSKDTRSKSYINGDLRLIVAEAKKNKYSAYQALKNNGVIKSPIQDFLQAAS
jgi:hypothetical protein